jgi:Protein of unknown function (DUF1566)
MQCSALIDRLVYLVVGIESAHSCSQEYVFGVRKECCTAATNFIAITERSRVLSSYENTRTEEKIVIEGNGKTKLILEEGSEVVIVCGGIRIEFNANSIEVYGDVPVTVHGAASDTAAPAEPRPGDTMPDGTKYAGVSPDTGQPMYTMPVDAPLTMEWEQAMNYAVDLYAHGHQDWCLPTKAELLVLFNNRAGIGGFDESGSDPSGWYWSATEHPGHPDIAWMERFSDGDRNWYWKVNVASVRPVRSELHHSVI